MVSPPVDEERILSRLRAEYAINATYLTMLPLGHARDSWILRAETGRHAFFLKLKSQMENSGPAVAAHLAAMGVPAVCPIASLSGQLTVRLDSFHLLVFPWTDSKPVELATLDSEGWRELGKFVRDIHSAPLPAELQSSLPRASFSPYGQDALAQISSGLLSVDIADEVGQEFKTIWSLQNGRVRKLLQAATDRGKVALSATARWCLCHGDLQAGNILQSESGKLSVVDWHSPLWGPAEGDLMLIEARYRSQFEAGYGPLNLNERILEYLSTNWLLQELLDCAERITSNRSANQDERLWALRYFTDLAGRIEL